MPTSASFRSSPFGRQASGITDISESPLIEMKNKVLNTSWFDTVLGPMIAVSDDQRLYLLEFADKPGLDLELESFKLQTESGTGQSHAVPIESIKIELKSYFEGRLTVFKTPLCLRGSPFRTLVWEELLRIPYGQTRTYAQQSEAIGKPKAYRAAANANAANQLAIIVPCHRVINSNGGLGGYAGGIMRKRWLIDHEKKYRSPPKLPRLRER